MSFNGISCVPIVCDLNVFITRRGFCLLKPKLPALLAAVHDLVGTCQACHSLNVLSLAMHLEDGKSQTQILVVNTYRLVSGWKSDSWLRCGSACAGEMCRFGAGELHCVAAVMGGLASQEAIKLITRQFVPVAGTLIYNAMASTTSLFEF